MFVRLTKNLFGHRQHFLVNYRFSYHLSVFFLLPRVGTMLLPKTSSLLISRVQMKLILSKLWQYSEKDFENTVKLLQNLQEILSKCLQNFEKIFK